MVAINEIKQKVVERSTAKPKEPVISITGTVRLNEMNVLSLDIVSWMAIASPNHFF
jgi:hypothetical protein